MSNPWCTSKWQTLLYKAIFEYSGDFRVVEPMSTFGGEDDEDYFPPEFDYFAEANGAATAAFASSSSIFLRSSFAPQLFERIPLFFDDTRSISLFSLFSSSAAEQSSSLQFCPVLTITDSGPTMPDLEDINNEEAEDEYADFAPAKSHSVVSDLLWPFLTLTSTSGSNSYYFSKSLKKLRICDISSELLSLFSVVAHQFTSLETFELIACHFLGNEDVGIDSVKNNLPKLIHELPSLTDLTIGLATPFPSWFWKEIFGNDDNKNQLEKKLKRLQLMGNGEPNNNNQEDFRQVVLKSFLRNASSLTSLSLGQRMQSNEKQDILALSESLSEARNTTGVVNYLSRFLFCCTMKVDDDFSDFIQQHSPFAKHIFEESTAMAASSFSTQQLDDEEGDGGADQSPPSDSARLATIDRREGLYYLKRTDPDKYCDLVDKITSEMKKEKEQIAAIEEQILSSSSSSSSAAVAAEVDIMTAMTTGILPIASFITHLYFTSDNYNITNANSADLLLAAHLSPTLSSATLQVLDLSTQVHLSDKTAKLRISHLRNLTHLNLEACSGLRDDGIRYIAQRLSLFGNLKSLKLAVCSYLTDQSLCHISNLTSLTYLDLTRVWQGTHCGMKFIGERLTNLQTLLCDCLTLGTEGAKHISKLSNLTHLDLTECRLNDEAISYLVGYDDIDCEQEGDAPNKKRRRNKLDKLEILRLPANYEVTLEGGAMQFVEAARDHTREGGGWGTRIRELFVDSDFVLAGVHGCQNDLLKIFCGTQ